MADAEVDSYNAPTPSTVTVFGRRINLLKTGRFLVGGGVLITAVGILIGPPIPLIGLILFTLGLLAMAPLKRVASFPIPCVAYVGLWGSFVLLRGFGDDTPWTSKVSHWVPNLEKRLFGEMPSVFLQRHLFELNNLHWYDYALTAVYYSFFYVPVLVAAILIVRNRHIFWFYFLSLVLVEGASLLIHMAIPTDPPWKDDYSIIKIIRVTGPMMGLAPPTEGGISGPTIMGTDTNPLAAMPSVHIGVTATLALVAWRFGPIWLRIPAIIYAGAMAISLVYFGEHYILDELVGLGLAIGGGIFAKRVIASDFWRALSHQRVHHLVRNRFVRPQLVAPAIFSTSPTESAD